MNNFFTEVLVLISHLLAFMSAETLYAKNRIILYKTNCAYMVKFCSQVKVINIKLALFVPRISLFLILAYLLC
jgi:hypothetical protein